MRSCFKALCFATLFCAVTLLAGPSSFQADAASPKLQTIEGLFEGMEESKDGWIIILYAKGQKMSGRLAPECRYYVEGTKRVEVSREEFLEQAIDQLAYVDLNESTGEILECRALIR